MQERQPVSHPVSAVLLESPLHRQGTDAPPAAIKATSGLLDGVALCVGGAGIAVVQEHLAQVQYGRHSCAVLLDVALKLLRGEDEHKVSTDHDDSREIHRRRPILRT